MLELIDVIPTMGSLQEFQLYVLGGICDYIPQLYHLPSLISKVENLNVGRFEEPNLLQQFLGMVTRYYNDSTDARMSTLGLLMKMNDEKFSRVLSAFVENNGKNKVLRHLEICFEILIRSRFKR